MASTPRIHPYVAHGLRLDSQLELPGLLPGSGPADVLVQLGQVPPRLEQPLLEGVRVQADDQQVLIWLDGVARFLVCGGERITVQICGPESEPAARALLLSVALGALLHRRGLLALHGAAVQTSQGAALFLGPSGVGKSTLVAGLSRAGHRVLTDDIAVVRGVSGGSPWVEPGAPLLKLWADMLPGLGLSATDLQPVRPELDKYLVPLGPQHCPDPLPLWRIFALTHTQESVARVSDLQGVSKVQALADNIYRPLLLPAVERQRQFGQLMQLVQSCPVVRLERPAEGKSAQQLVQRVARELA